MILEYKFSIDTGDSTPVCCKKSHYGPHELVIIMKYIRVFLGNDWIEQCKSGLGLPKMLAPKPHQESIIDIEECLWWMYISYRRLSKVTQPLKYPIGCYDTVIKDLGDASSIFISSTWTNHKDIIK